MPATANPTAQEIERLLQRLAPLHVRVRDDSAAHAGHHGSGGKGHFHVTVVSARFEGLTALARHRLVNEMLAPLFETHVHALGVETLTPDEFKK